MSRRTLVLGKSVASFLGLFIAWSALWTTPSGIDFTSTARAEETRLTRELVVLAFVDRDVPQCERPIRLLEEMSRKKYPIQFVERSAGGDALFEQYDVKTTPAFVFLIDDKEFKRFVVGDETIKEVRDRLLNLFDECRKDSTTTSEGITTRGQAPNDERSASSDARKRNVPKYGRTVALPAKSEFSNSVNASVDASTRSVSEYGSQASSSVDSYVVDPTISRPCLAQVRAFVGVRGSSEERVGNGVVVHYNEEYGEALTLVPASLFADVGDPLKGTNTTVEIVSSTSNSRERSFGQCVFCDARSGVALVAARVASPVAPVAFLPKNDSPRVGEFAAVATFNAAAELVPIRREIISLGSDSMRLAVGAGQDQRGCGVFLVRNDRLYFSGLFTSTDAEGCGVVAPVSLIEQILLANSNLSTVYRDQVSGKYEALSLTSFEPQSSASLSKSAPRVDLNDVAPSTNMSDVWKGEEIDSTVMDALSRLPNGFENVPNDPNLRLDSPNAPTLDAAPVFANSGESRAMRTSVSDAPSVLKNPLDSNAALDANGNADTGASIALATNEDKATAPRAQEIPMASREIGGVFTDANEIRSTNYASRQNDKIPTANDQETRLFESSLDELRRMSLEGAEIICIVNWNASSDGTRPRETEVVRLPRLKSDVGADAKGVDVAWTFGETSSAQTAEGKKDATPSAVPSQKSAITGVSELGLLR